MVDKIFVQNRAHGFVAAAFLSYRGSYLSDPNKASAIQAHIYDSAGTIVNNANPNGYFIVPVNYTIDKAVDFSNTVSTMLICNGISSAYGMMVGAFVPKGPQDLQRTYPGSEGLSAGAAFVPAFTNSASFHFGLVSELSGIGESAALHGGGALNESHLYQNKVTNSIVSLERWLGLHGRFVDLPDTSGVDGNNPSNVKSIHAGVLFARELRQRYGIHSPDLGCSLMSPFISPY